MARRSNRKKNRQRNKIEAKKTLAAEKAETKAKVLAELPELEISDMFLGNATTGQIVETLSKGMQRLRTSLHLTAPLMTPSNAAASSDHYVKYEYGKSSIDRPPSELYEGMIDNFEDAGKSLQKLVSDRIAEEILKLEEIVNDYKGREESTKALEVMRAIKAFCESGKDTLVTEHSRRGRLYKADFHGNSFAKSMPGCVYPGNIDHTERQPDESQAEVAAFQGEAGDDWNYRVRPFEVESPPEFRGFDTLMGAMERCPEQLFPKEFSVSGRLSRLLDKVELFHINKKPQDFLHHAFQGDRSSASYINAMERAMDNFFLPHPVSAFTDKTSCIILFGKNNRQGLDQPFYFISVDTDHPTVSMTEWTPDAKRIYEEINSDSLNAEDRGASIISTGVVHGFTFLGGKPAAQIIINRFIRVGRSGKLKVDARLGIEDMFGIGYPTPEVVGRSDRFHRAALGNILTAIEEIIFVNNQAVEETKEWPYRSPPVNKAFKKKRVKIGGEKRDLKKRISDRPLTVFLTQPEFEAKKDPVKNPDGTTKKSPKGHSRRAHYKTLSHDRFKKSGKQGTQIFVKACYVGVKDGHIAGDKIGLGQFDRRYYAVSKVFDERYGG